MDVWNKVKEKKKGEKKQKKKLKGGKILVWYLDSFMLGVVY